MSADFSQLAKYLKLLADTLSFRADYASFCGKKRRILIVEGRTDSSFLERMLVPDVVCEVASNVIRGTISMEIGWGRREAEKFNCKDVIVQIVKGLVTFPPDFIPNCPRDVANWDVYGMVDSDYQDPSIFRSVTKLFMTDTSDLETLILSTDGEVLTRIEKLSLKHEEIKKGFTWAYQFAKVRNAMIELLPEKEISVASLLASSREIEYSHFISEENGINVLEMLKYMCVQGGLSLSREKIRKLCTNIITKDKYLKKKVDKNTFAWVWTDSQGTASDQKDFWNVVNGHTILNMLKYASRNVALYYAGQTGERLNRQFETELIGQYDYGKFYSTSLFQSMFQAKLVSYA